MVPSVLGKSLLAYEIHKCGNSWTRRWRKAEWYHGEPRTGRHPLVLGGASPSRGPCLLLYTESTGPDDCLASPRCSILWELWLQCNMYYVTVRIWITDPVGPTYLIHGEMQRRHFKEIWNRITTKTTQQLLSRYWDEPIIKCTMVCHNGWDTNKRVLF